MDIRHGITGNKYVTSSNKQDVIDICLILDKSINSIYWSKKYKVWAIRIKSKKHKHMLRYV